MSSPGDPVAVRAGDAPTLATFRHLVLNWLLAEHRQTHLQVEAPPAVCEGLRWLQVPFREGSAASSLPRVAAPWDQRPGDFEVGEFPVCEPVPPGFLSEATLCLLAQAGWRRHPEDDWENLTRGELLIRFRPEGLLRHTVAYDAARWREINAQRLQELAPSELLAEVRPYLKRIQKDDLQLEAEIMICCEEVSDLRELAERLT